MAVLSSGESDDKWRDVDSANMLAIEMVTIHPASHGTRFARWRSLACLLSLVAAIQLGACTDRQSPPVEAAAPSVALDPATPPAVLFADLENRLLNAPSMHLRYTARSEGAFNASLTGTLHLTQRSGVELRAEGTFGDAPATLHLRSDSETMEGGSAQRTFREATPPALREALILGLTRMGILHNLARLTGGAAPDHAGGGVREWVEVRDVQLDADAAGANPEWLALRLPIHVSGTRTAEATLWLDRRTGLPVQRNQVVTFPGGSMSVVERYVVCIACTEAPSSGDSLTVEVLAAGHLLERHPNRQVWLDSAFALSGHAPGTPTADLRPSRRTRLLADSLKARLSRERPIGTARLTLSEPEFAGDSAMVTVTVSFDTGRRPLGRFYETVLVFLRRAGSVWRVERSEQLGIS